MIYDYIDYLQYKLQIIAHIYMILLVYYYVINYKTMTRICVHLHNHIFKFYGRLFYNIKVHKHKYTFHTKLWIENTTIFLVYFFNSLNIFSGFNAYFIILGSYLIYLERILLLNNETWKYYFYVFLFD